MKKEFMKPELEVLRFQKGIDVLLTSEGEIDMDDDANPGYGVLNFRAGGGSRGFFDNGVD